MITMDNAVEKIAAAFKADHLMAADDVWLKVKRAHGAEAADAAWRKANRLVPIR